MAWRPIMKKNNKWIKTDSILLFLAIRVLVALVAVWTSHLFFHYCTRHMFPVDRLSDWGGNASVRGLNRNGVIGNGMAWLYVELRWRKKHIQTQTGLHTLSIFIRRGM